MIGKSEMHPRRDFGAPPPGYIPGIGRGASAIISGVSRVDKAAVVPAASATSRPRIVRKDDQDADTVYDQIDALMRSRNKLTRTALTPATLLSTGLTHATTKRAIPSEIAWDSFTEAVPQVKKPKTKSESSKPFPTSASNVPDEASNAHHIKLLESLAQTTPNEPDVYLGLVSLNPGKKRQYLATARLHCPRDLSVWLASLDHDYQATCSLAMRVMAEFPDIWLKIIAQEPDSARPALVQQGLKNCPQSAELWKLLLDQTEDSELVLRKAVKAVKELELWLQLIRLRPADVQSLLNEARAIFREEERALRAVWVEAGRFAAEQGVQGDGLVGLWKKAIDDVLAATRLTTTFTTTVTTTTDKWWEEVNNMIREDEELARSLVRALIDDWTEVESMEYANAQVRDFVLKVASETSGDPDLWFRRLVELSTATVDFGKDEEVIKLVQEAIRRTEGEEMVTLVGAKVLMRRGYVREAIDIVRTGIASYSESVEMMLALAKLLTSVGEFEEAVEVLETAGRVGNHGWRVEMKLAVVLVMKGEVNRAKRVVKTALDKQINAWKLHCMYMQLDNFSESAIEAAVKTCSGKAEVWAVASEGLLSRGMAGEARSTLERGRVKIPDSEILWVKSIQLELLCDRLDAAKLLLAKAITACPSSGLMWAFAIQLEDATSRFSKCAEALKRCPEDALVMAEVGKFFWQVKHDLGKARKWLENAVRANPKDGDVRLLLLAFELAVNSQTRVEAFNTCLAALPDCNRGFLWTPHAKKFENLTKSLKQLVAEFIDIHYSDVVPDLLSLVLASLACVIPSRVFSMAAATHNRQGAAALLALFTFWIYATVWLLITPFYDNSLLMSFFPDRLSFITGCVLLGTAFLVTVAVTTGVILAYYPNLVK